MKVFHIIKGDNDIFNYFSKLQSCETIEDVDVVIINGERYNYISMKPEERVDTDHYISYDYKDICFHTMGIGSRTNFDEYILMEEKIINRIKPYEEIILIANSWEYDSLRFIAYLKEKKNFILHLILGTSTKFDSDDYHQFLRKEEYLHIINSICYINSYPIKQYFNQHDKDDELREYLFEKVAEAIHHIKNLDHRKFYIYNHKLKNYTENERPPKNGDSIFEYITPSENTKMCEVLYSYRKAFANKYDITYNSQPCGECKCNGYCNSVCEECDKKSAWLWAEKYEFPYYENDDYPYEYDVDSSANINGIERLRIDTDGNGIRSLILMAGCPLDCKYCGNKNYKDIFPETRKISIDSIGSYLEKDGVYFEMTDGGVTFGGGEPLLQADFIHEFHKKYPMWDIVIETCLYVEFANIEKIAGDVGYWYIDIKDMNPEIYQNYTGATNESVVRNLEKLSSVVPTEKICIRVPRIPGYNTEQDVTNSVAKLRALGYTIIEIFDYIV